jgi:hypothetical protein
MATVLSSVPTVRVMAPMLEGPPPPLPQLAVAGNEGTPFEPIGLRKPLQKLATVLVERGGADRSARMQTRLRAAKF